MGSNKKSKKKDTLSSKPKNLKSVIQLRQQLESDFKSSIPFDAWRVFGSLKYINISNDQIQLTENGDPLNIDEFQNVLAWWVEQLGGKVQWKAEK